MKPVKHKRAAGTGPEKAEKRARVGFVGREGKQGPKGDPGPRGPVGPPGSVDNSLTTYLTGIVPGEARRRKALVVDDNKDISGIRDVTTTGTVTASEFSGALTGNVTGDVTGNAGTVTNGVYTIGDQTIEGTKTFTNLPTFAKARAPIRWVTDSTNFNTIAVTADTYWKIAEFRGNGLSGNAAALRVQGISGSYNPDAGIFMKFDFVLTNRGGIHLFGDVHFDEHEEFDRVGEFFLYDTGATSSTDVKYILYYRIDGSAGTKSATADFEVSGFRSVNATSGTDSPNAFTCNNTSTTSPTGTLFGTVPDGDDNIQFLNGIPAANGLLRCLGVQHKDDGSNNVSSKSNSHYFGGDVYSHGLYLSKPEDAYNFDRGDAMRAFRFTISSGSSNILSLDYMGGTVEDGETINNGDIFTIGAGGAGTFSGTLQVVGAINAGGKLFEAGLTKLPIHATARYELDAANPDTTGSQVWGNGAAADMSGDTTNNSVTGTLANSFRMNSIDPDDVIQLRTGSNGAVLFEAHASTYPGIYNIKVMMEVNQQNLNNRCLVGIKAGYEGDTTGDRITGNYKDFDFIKAVGVIDKVMLQLDFNIEILSTDSGNNQIAFYTYIQNATDITKSVFESTSTVTDKISITHVDATFTYLGEP